MLFFWLLVVIFCVTAIPMVKTIQQMKKTDQILFKLHQSRRTRFRLMMKQNQRILPNNM